MKKLLIVLTIAVLSIFALTACGESDEQKAAAITVGASPSPHAEILKVAKDILAEEGYTLEIREFTDYVQPNVALDAGDIDANFFQHQPYLDEYNAQNGTNLTSVAAIHYEPLGLYSGKSSSIDELNDGATIAVPNDTTNEARALLLLEIAGLIKVDPNAGLTATINDIVENPKNLKIEEIEAAQVARTLNDVDMAVINGNYALLAELDVESALILEGKDSDAATTYANIIAVNEGDENREDIKALVDALKSEKIKEHIESTYSGAVAPF